jgi:hypothetical protein
MLLILLITLHAGCNNQPDMDTNDSTTLESGLTAEVEFVSSFTISTNPNMELERRFAVETQGVSDVSIVCEQNGELLLVESEVVNESHELRLFGLMFDTTYDCVALVTGEDEIKVEQISFTTALAPDLFPTFTASGDSSGSWLLFNNLDFCRFQTDENVLIITDTTGRPRWYYSVPESMDMDLDIHLISPNEIFFGGGWGRMDLNKPDTGIQRNINLSGETISERLAPEFGLSFNHHSEPLGDGRRLSLTSSINENEDMWWLGVGVELWHETDGLLWSWDSQSAYDAGTLPGSDTPEKNPYWANAAQLVDNDTAVMLSMYLMKQLVKIDMESGEIVWTLGPEGDFRLVNTSGAPLPPSEWIYGTHAPEWDGDRVLVYDNGNSRPGGNETRVSEYEIDTVTMTATKLWSYTEDDWKHPILGDVDRLASGGVLITAGNCSCCNGDDPAYHPSSLMELSETDHEVVWRMDWDSELGSVYRGELLGGCDIFSDAVECLEVAERVSVVMETIESAR